ncbi:hypothetical protein HK100_004016 [Physocladia obscura]|uniref:Uncharacterized protein n=1 Tax=Physocladia obscura TaxID=109957 RepID=A0AAD5STE6_9FUNG|nr:hypothetical protein HK100_004016 [Physocladia obscura]
MAPTPESPGPETADVDAKMDKLAAQLDGNSNSSLAHLIGEAVGVALDGLESRLFARLDNLDSRLGAVEAHVSSIASISNASGANTASGGNYASGLSHAAAQATQEQLVRLSGAVETLVTVARKSENVLADAVDNMSWALEQFAATQVQPQPQVQPAAIDTAAIDNDPAANTTASDTAETLNNDARPLSISSSGSSSTALDSPVLDRLNDAIASMNARMESVESLSKSLVKDIVDKVSVRHHELEQDVQSVLKAISESRDLDAARDQESRDADKPTATIAPQENNAQLLAKLALIEQKFELLPQLYIDQVTLSLQKQTKSLLTVIDDIKVQQADAIRASAHSNKNRVAVNNTSSILNSVPNIPNMGIATR